MQVKKSNGTIFGATLTTAERKALDMEIRRQFTEYTRKYELEIESMFLLAIRVYNLF